MYGNISKAWLTWLTEISDWLIANKQDLKTKHLLAVIQSVMLNTKIWVIFKVISYGPNNDKYRQSKKSKKKINELYKKNNKAL